MLRHFVASAMITSLVVGVLVTSALAANDPTYNFTLNVGAGDSRYQLRGAHNGELAFVVRETGSRSSLPGLLETLYPRGEAFFVIRVWVYGMGNRPVDYSYSSFELLSPEGRVYSPHDEAMLWWEPPYGDETMSVWDTVQPDTQTNVWLVFDVPRVITSPSEWRLAYAPLFSKALYVEAATRRISE